MAASLHNQATDLSPSYISSQFKLDAYIWFTDLLSSFHLLQWELHYLLLMQTPTLSLKDQQEQNEIEIARSMSVQIHEFGFWYKASFSKLYHSAATCYMMLPFCFKSTN